MEAVPARSRQHVTALKYAAGGLSCMAAAFITNPVDVIKIRLQIQGQSVKKLQAGGAVAPEYRGFVRGVFRIAQNEGINGLYKGLSASLLREATYSTLRVGGYETMKELLGATDPSHTPLWKKIISGAVSGAVGSAIANPTDLVKVRMQACGAKTKADARYKSMLHAFAQIWRDNGLRGLYQGVFPNVQRAAVLSAVQLGSYDHVKHFTLNHVYPHEGFVLYLTSSMIAGLFSAIATNPVDVMKTRIMNQKRAPDGTGLVYSGSLDCLKKTIMTEGPMSLYKGFLPSWIRIGPHTVITFVIYEQLRSAFSLAPV